MAAERRGEHSDYLLEVVCFPPSSPAPFSPSTRCFVCFSPHPHCMTADVTYFDLPPVFQVNAVVGQGGYGAVCRAVVHAPLSPSSSSDASTTSGSQQPPPLATAAAAMPPRTVAIKKIPQYNKNIDTAKKVYRELRVLKHLQNVAQVVPCHALIRPPPGAGNDVYIVMDYFPSDLSGVIKSIAPGDLDEEKIHYLVAQLLLGLRGSHKAGIIHRDLSTRNLLVDAACTLSIADFGLARFFDPEERMSFGVVTQWYRAPEVLTDAKYDAKIDVWSAGVTMAELFIRGHLFAGKPNDLVDQLNKIMKVVGVPDPSLMRNSEFILGSSSENAVRYVERVAKQVAGKNRATLFQPDGPKFVVPMSGEARDLLGKLLVFNPDERLSADAALRHPWFHAPSVHDFIDDEIRFQDENVQPFPADAFHQATATLTDIVGEIERLATPWSPAAEAALFAAFEQQAAQQAGGGGAPGGVPVDES